MTDSPTAKLQVELRPDGFQLAYCQRDEQCACICHVPPAQHTTGGAEIKRLDFKKPCDGIHWSADGRTLVAHGGFGAKVFDATTFEETHSFVDKNWYVGDCRLSADGRLVASCGASAAVTVRALPTAMAAFTPEQTEESFGPPLCKFDHKAGFTASVCFDAAGERVAYCYVDFMNFKPPREVVAICDVRRNAVLHTVGAEPDQVGFKAHVKGFSPCGRWLLCYESANTADVKGGVFVVDTTTGAIAVRAALGRLSALSVPPPPQNNVGCGFCMGARGA
jgi:hypothetical protein